MKSKTYNTGRKSSSIALALCILGGWFGAHQYYVGKIGTGIIYTATGGIFFIGWILDIFKICSGSFRDKYGMPLMDSSFSKNISTIRQYPLPSPDQTNEAINVYDYDSLDGHQFEYFCANVVIKNGFKNVEVTQGSGDHGIDITAEKDGITYAIQCKCYSSNIGNAAVQQAHTGKSLYHKDIAVVMTNRYFTAQAKQEAQALGVKLWDRDKLNEMIG